MGDKRATLLLLLILQSVFVTFSWSGVVEASGTVYIRADGSVEGTDKISRNGNLYSFTGDIYGSVVVEKDNVVVDGMGYSIEGTNIGLAQQLEGIGILVDNQNEVTITNVTVQQFQYGIYINRSSNSILTENNIKNNINGVTIEHSSQTKIRKSQIINNLAVGIYALESPDTIFQNNEIANNGDGILFFASINFSDHNYFNVHECSIRANNVGIQILNSLNSSSTSLVTGGNITSNDIGAYIEGSFVCVQSNNIKNNNVGIQLAGSGNEIDHNNFINNTKQVYDLAWDNPEMPPSVNSWYEGDTGNYWSDYTSRYPNATEKENTGAWNIPYVLDNNNQDNFPTIKRFIIPRQQWNPPEDVRISNMFWSLIIVTILAVTISLFIYYVLKKKRQKNQGI